MVRKAKRRRDGISYRAWDDSWYSSVTGKKEPLRDDHGRKIRGRDNEAAAKAAYHRLAAEMATPGASIATLGTIVVDYIKKLRTEGAAASSVRNSTYVLENFLSFVGEDKAAAKLRPADVDKWLASHPKWSPTTICDVVIIVKAALNHAVKKTGRLTESPLFRYGTVKAEARTEVVLPEQFKVLLEVVTPDFRQFLQALNETGARPGELASTEAKHFHDGERYGQIVLPWTLHKTGRKTRRPRVIPLSAEATLLVRRLASIHPAGTLFRSYHRCPRGRAWSPARVGRRFWYAKKRANALLPERLKMGDKITLYTLRHTFATRKIDAGVPIERVASWLGNTVAMVQKHYWHAFHRANVNLYVGLDD